MRTKIRTMARLGLFAAFAVAAAGFAAEVNVIYAVGIGLIMTCAAALMIIEVTWPNPKDAPAPTLPDATDRKRWDEAPLDSPWDEHTICTKCNGQKLCPSCGGEGGCHACDGLAWCSLCGGAGQWPDDPQRPIYTPAPSAHRARAF